MADVPDHPADGEPTLEQWRRELQEILDKTFADHVFPWPPSQEILDGYARKVAEEHYAGLLVDREYGVDWKATGKLEDHVFTALVSVRVGPPRDHILISIEKT